jgi:hypothetical protein
MGWVVNSTPRPLYPRKRPVTHCIGGWVGPRAGMDGCGKSYPTRIRSPDRPARSESLYRLRIILIVISRKNFLKRKSLLIQQCLGSRRRHFLLPVVKLSLGLNRTPVCHSRGERGKAAAHGPFCEASRSVFI